MHPLLQRAAPPSSPARDVDGVARGLHVGLEGRPRPRGQRLVLGALIGVQGEVARHHAIDEQRSGVAIDGREASETDALLDVVNARRTVSGTGLCPVMSVRKLMIGFPPAGQYVRVIESRPKHGVLLDRAAAVRTHERGEIGGVNPDFLESVAIQVEALDLKRLAPPQLRLGQREVAPDRVAEVGEVEAAEHAVPVGVVALRPRDRLPRLDGIAAAAAQGGEGHHFLVHAVRFGVAHEEVAPMRPAEQRPVGTGDSLRAQVVLEPGQPRGGLRWQRPGFHLAV